MRPRLTLSHYLRKMVHTLAKTNQNESTQMLHLNLRIFFLTGLGLIFFISPFLRGLYFQAELLPVLILVAVSFMFCIYDQVLRREIELLHSPLDWAMAALVLASGLSLITAVHLRPAISELLKTAAYFMVYWMAYRAAKVEKNHKFLLLVIYLAGIGVALIGILAAAGVFQLPGAYAGGRIMSTLQYPNTLAIYLVALNIIGLALGVKAERLFARLFYAAGNLLMIVVIVGTQSRGGWILFPLAIALFIYLIQYTYRWRAIYHLMIYLGCGMVAAQGFFNTLKSGTGNALTPVLYGLLAVIVLQTLYYFLGMWLNRDTVREYTRKLVAAGGFIYLGLVMMVYLWYAAAAFPVAAAGFLSGDTISRSQHISVQENSFQARMEFSQDALEIVKDYPLTGAGGGGWNALYHSYADRIYWTTETHNYFFQTWVESGTIGFLALIAVVVFFSRLLINFRRKTGDADADEDEDVLIWAVATAVFMLLVHSGFDFDLSLAAIGFLLYGLIGFVKGRTEAVLNNDLVMRKKTVNPPSNRKLTATAVIGTIFALGIIYPAHSFYLAGTAGAKGAEALLQKNLEGAEPYYLEAIKRDPFTASYLVDLAQIRAAQALADDDAAAYFESLHYAEEASRVAPCDIRVHSTLVNLYSTLGEDELMVGAAEALVKANPLLISNYEILAAALLDAVHHEIKSGKYEQADVYLKQVLDIKNNFPAAIEKSTPGLDLAVGQAALLLGEKEQARDYLSDIQGSEEVNYQAQLWLAAAYTLEGNEPEATKILDALSSKNSEVYSDYQSIMQIIYRGDT